MSVTNASNSGVADVDHVGENKFVITGLENDDTYFFQVRVNLGVGDYNEEDSTSVAMTSNPAPGPASAEVSATTAAAPGVVDDLEIMVGTREATLTWDAARSSEDVTGWQVFYYNEDDTAAGGTLAAKAQRMDSMRACWYLTLHGLRSWRVM